MAWAEPALGVCGVTPLYTPAEGENRPHPVTRSIRNSGAAQSEGWGGLEDLNKCTM